MKVFHINEFKCTLCSNWFCPPFNLPYRLKCTHSICTNCLQKSVTNNSQVIICPEDLERNLICQININQSTKRALERLLKEHKNFSQTNHLECIKALSLSFDEILDSKQVQLKNLSTLIDQVFSQQVKRLNLIYTKIKQQINYPFKIVNDWKTVVRQYLNKIKKERYQIDGTYVNKYSGVSITEMNHYIDQGRKIKLELGEYLKMDFNQAIELLLEKPQICFNRTSAANNTQKIFSIFQDIKDLTHKVNKLTTENKKSKLRNNLSNKQIQISEPNLQHSSIQVLKANNNKSSLFEQLLQQTPNRASKFQKSPDHYYQNKENSYKESQTLKSKSPLSKLIPCSDFKNKISREKIKQNASVVGPDYNEKIKEKIRKLRNSSNKDSGNGDYIEQNSRVQQKNEEKFKTNNKKSDKISKLLGSLEYSPDNNGYTNTDKILQNLYLVEQSQQKSSYYENQTNNRKHDLLKQKSFLMNSEQSKRSVQNQQEDNEELLLQNQQQKSQTSKVLNSIDNTFPHQTRNPTNKAQSLKTIQQPHPNSNTTSQSEKILPTQSNWYLQHINFMKEWKINTQCSNTQDEDLEIITKYGGYNCEEEKEKYMKKIQEKKVLDLLKELKIGENYVQLVGQELSSCNVELLLQKINWTYRNVEIVKFIKTYLSDQQLNTLLNFLLHSNVHTLMLAYNNLTEKSLDALLNFIEINKKLKNIYLPKNNISLLKGNARAKINLLKEKGINLYI